MQDVKMFLHHIDVEKKQKSKPNKKRDDKDCFTDRQDLKSVLNAINRQPYSGDLQAKYFVRRKAYNRKVNQRKKAHTQ